VHKFKEPEVDVKRQLMISLTRSSAVAKRPRVENLVSQGHSK